jgi:sugar lactone lactonase YvrE
MTIVDMNFRVAVPFQSQCAETPIWDARIEKLYWIDLFPGDVHRYDPLTGADEVFASHDGPIGSAVPTSDTGKMLVAGASGIRVLD